MVARFSTGIEMAEFQSPDADPKTNQSDDTQLTVETMAHAGQRHLWPRLWRAGGLAEQPLTMRQKVWRVGGITLTLALVAVLFGQSLASLAGNAWNRAFPPPPGPIATCLHDAQWSPSGNRLAVLGYTGNCGETMEHLSGVLDIYDGTGQRRIRQIALDTLLVSAETRLAQTVDTDHISLGQVLWLNGEKQLAITFSLPPRAGSGQTTTEFGIITLDPSGANGGPRVQFEEILNRYGTYYPIPGISLIWDLATGHTQMIASATQYFYENALPLAYQYKWSGQGVVADSRNQMSIGNAQSGASFALWQAGWLTSISPTDAATNGDAHVFFQTNFAAVSPDGRFVMAPIAMQTLVAPHLSGPTPPQPDNHGELPIVLTRDQAFLKILQSIPTNTAAGAAMPITYIAWRPDGKQVATFNLKDDQKVNIYDCATGRLLKSVSEPPQPSTFSGILGALRWSPDGERLMLLDGAVLTV
jgi:WD40 repeat protein